MKIRQGFVSNSSSSSFCIQAHPTTVAKSMFKDLVADYTETEAFGDNDDDEITTLWNGEYTKNLDLITAREDFQNGKIGITMPSTNYDTWIVGEYDMMESDGWTSYVKTCNNIWWDLKDNLLLINSYAEGDEPSSFEERFNSKDQYFYNIRNLTIHTHSIYGSFVNGKYIHSNNCEFCSEVPYSYVIDAYGNYLCGWCFNGILEKGGSKSCFEKPDEDKGKIIRIFT